MATTTPTNVGRNNVLLFGDYGTEIMRLTQLYDPKQDRYQKSTDPRPIEGEKYFTITLRNRTIYFNEVEDITAYTKDGTAIGEFRTDVTLWKDTGKECQNGYYVPVTQTMVVVDKATEKWGTYTLLIVDAVDPETYESTLVPVNFTGGVDTAIRAIDWNNNLLNLFNSFKVFIPYGIISIFFFVCVLLYTELVACGFVDYDSFSLCVAHSESDVA